MEETKPTFFTYSVTVMDASKVSQSFGVPYSVTVEIEGEPPSEYIADSLMASLSLASLDIDRRIRGY